MADTIKEEVFVVKLTYKMSVNIDTGEILNTELVSRDIDNSDLKKSKSSETPVPDNDKPTLTLEENKYRLNKAAITLMGLDETSKLVIKYEDTKVGSIPVIGTNTAFGVSSGNKLTKSNTVACRGNNHDELAKYGSQFTIIPHASKSGIFILDSGNNKVKQIIEDDNVKIEGNEGDDIPFDIDINELVSNEDENITEVDSDFFKL